MANHRKTFLAPGTMASQDRDTCIARTRLFRGLLCGDVRLADFSLRGRQPAIPRQDVPEVLRGWPEADRKSLAATGLHHIKLWMNVLRNCGRDAPSEVELAQWIGFEMVGDKWKWNGDPKAQSMMLMQQRYCDPAPDTAILRRLVVAVWLLRDAEHLLCPDITALSCAATEPPSGGLTQKQHRGWLLLLSTSGRIFRHPEGAEQTTGPFTTRDGAVFHPTAPRVDPLETPRSKHPTAPRVDPLEEPSSKRARMKFTLKPKMRGLLQPEPAEVEMLEAPAAAQPDRVPAEVEVGDAPAEGEEAPEPARGPACFPQPAEVDEAPAAPEPEPVQEAAEVHGDPSEQPAEQEVELEVPLPERTAVDEATAEEGEAVAVAAVPPETRVEPSPGSAVEEDPEEAAGPSPAPGQEAEPLCEVEEEAAEVHMCDAQLEPDVVDIPEEPATRSGSAVGDAEHCMRTTIDCCKHRSGFHVKVKWADYSVEVNSWTR